MNKIEIKETQRGFKRGEFKDAYGVECSIQKSSSAGEDYIWLGVNNERMLLSKLQVKKLLPLLNYFAKNGDLPDGNP